MFTGFSKAAFQFFEHLAKNNNRDWFRAHQDVYEQSCREPMKQLVEELGADATRSRITRINRDTRFSRDKAQYRTYIAAGVDSNYISLSTDGLWVGTGLYRPEPAALERLREAIDREKSGRELQKIVTMLRRKRYDVETHERLKSAPRGYDANHPRIELLRMKDIYAGRMFGAEAVSDRRLIGRIRQTIKDVKPLADWVRANVGGRE